MNLTEAAYLAKLTDVKRWGIVPTTRDQSVAEHSFRVWLLSLSLYDHIVAVPHNSNDREAVSYWALTHDADEVWTGDLPSTVKQDIEKLAPGLLKKLKDKVLIEHTPEHAARARGIEGSFPAAVVKLAECVEAYAFYSRYGYATPAIVDYLTEAIEKAAGRVRSGWGVTHFNDEEHLWGWIQAAKAAA